MKTREQQMKAGAIDGDHNFIGDDREYRNWLGVAGQSRDSKVLERCNFQVALERLGGESDNVRVERYGHWACGWIEEIYVRPDTPEAAIAAQIEADLERYPLLNEDLYGEMEWTEASETWAQFTVRDRVDYLRRYCRETSIFAARRSELPDDSGDLIYHLTE